MRRVIAKFYTSNISNKFVKKLKYSSGSVYHQYVILVKQKKEFIKLLIKKKIGFGFHYPYPINKLKALKNIYKNKQFYNAENLAKNGVSLPIDPKLTKKDISFIVNIINSYRP